MALSHLINSKLKDKKNGAESSFFDLPHEGVAYGTDFEPVYSWFTENSLDLKTFMVQISNRLNAVDLNEAKQIAANAPPLNWVVMWRSEPHKIQRINYA